MPCLVIGNRAYARPRVKPNRQEEARDEWLVVSVYGGILYVLGFAALIANLEETVPAKKDMWYCLAFCAALVAVCVPIYAYNLLTKILRRRLTESSITAVKDRKRNADAEIARIKRQRRIRQRIKDRTESQRRSEKLFQQGEGIKAKEVFGIGELQDSIFSHMNFAEIRKMKRVCRNFKSAVDNRTNTALQKKLRRIPGDTNQLDSEEELRHSLFATPDGQPREILVEGASTYIKLQFGWEAGSDPDNAGGDLIVQFFLKRAGGLEASLIDFHPPLTHCESARAKRSFFPTYIQDEYRLEIVDKADSRLDMVMPCPAMADDDNFKVVMTMDDGNTPYKFNLSTTPKASSDQHGKLVRELSHPYTAHSARRNTRESLGMIPSPGRPAPQDIPINGTVREMLVFLETYCMKEREVHEAKEMSNAWWSIGPTELFISLWECSLFGALEDW